MNKSEQIYNVLFWIALLAAVAVIASSLYFFGLPIFDMNLGILVVLTIVFSTFPQIQIPRTKIHVTISDTLIFIALLTYGVSVAVVLAVLESIITSLNFRYRGINIKTPTIFLNGALLGISTFITGVCAIGLFGSMPDVVKGADLSFFALMLCFIAAVQFLSNSILVAVFTGLKTKKRIWTVWFDQCLNGLIMYFIGASVAGLILKTLYGVETLWAVVVSVLTIIVYFTYRRYNVDVMETVEQAETAEKQRAEQAEKHIEELQLHIAQQDVTEKALRESREKFKHAAYHDVLTDLPNRNLFTKHLEFLLKRSKENNGKKFAVLFLDLNRFKTINDSLGHSTGDSLILGVAMRLSKMMREEDVVARLSGDEFAVILNGIEGVDDVVHFAELLRQKVSLPFTLDERQVFTGVSIGIAIGDDSYEAAEDILRDADIAMYQAKNSEKSYSIFDKQMHAKAVNLLEVETDLRYALDRKELVAFYQPIIDLKSMELIGFEALMRWNHPTRGLVPPGDFIPVSENTGLIIPMTIWILEDSCRKLAQWKADLPENEQLIMSVNLSGKHFAQNDLVAQVKRILKETGVDPSCLKLELTESAIMDNAESAISILNQLKTVGTQLSIDDFGTGYSSLSYLHRFPIDTLKIDRSFVSSMENGSENGEIVRTVIALAKALNLNIIAEGIETIHQLHQLRILGCEYGQGFLFSRPVPLEEAQALLEDKGRWKNIMPNQDIPVVQHREADTILQLGDF